MTFSAKFLLEATNEFRDYVDWYELKSKGLWLKFTDEPDATIERIKLNPDVYPVIVKNIRKIQVNNLPSPFFYKTKPTALIIIRIYHN